MRGADAVYVAVATQLVRDGGDEIVLGTFGAQQRRAALAAGIPVIR